jgi:hypothetical protein
LPTNLNNTLTGLYLVLKYFSFAFTTRLFHKDTKCQPCSKIQSSAFLFNATACGLFKPQELPCQLNPDSATYTDTKRDRQNAENWSSTLTGSWSQHPGIMSRQNIWTRLPSWTTEAYKQDRSDSRRKSAVQLQLLVTKEAQGRFPNRSRDNAVGVVTNLRHAQQMIRSSIPGTGKSKTRPHRQWGLPSLVLNAWQKLFLRG